MVTACCLSVSFGIVSVSCLLHAVSTSGSVCRGPSNLLIVLKRAAGEMFVGSGWGFCLVAGWFIWIVYRESGILVGVFSP